MRDRSATEAETRLGPQLVADLLREGRSVRVAVFGHSMVPCVRSGDEVLLTPLRSRPRLGDVVAVATEGRLLVHRVISRRREPLSTRGDMAEDADVLVTPELLGRVTLLWRGARPLRLGLGPGRFLLAWASRLGLLRRLASVRERLRRST